MEKILSAVSCALLYLCYASALLFAVGRTFLLSGEFTLCARETFFGLAVVMRHSTDLSFGIHIQAIGFIIQTEMCHRAGWNESGSLIRIFVKYGNVKPSGLVHEDSNGFQPIPGRSLPVNLRAYRTSLWQPDSIISDLDVPVYVVRGIGRAPVFSGFEFRKSNIRFREELSKSTLQMHLDISQCKGIYFFQIRLVLLVLRGCS